MGVAAPPPSQIPACALGRPRTTWRRGAATLTDGRRLAVASAVFFQLEAGSGRCEARDLTRVSALLTGASLPTNVDSASNNIPLRTPSS